MKLLLTSTGVTNQSIRRALKELIGKPIEESRVAFIPTAAYGTTGDKSWLAHEMQVASDLGWQEFNVIELTALTPEQIKEQLEGADVIYMNGGNAYFLMNRIVTSGLEKMLPELLAKKVYVSSSAGGSVVSKHFPGNLAKAYGEEERLKLEQGTIDHGLGLVDFIIKPHLNSPKFPKRKMAWYKRVAPQVGVPFYAIDDDTAIKVIDGQVEVISEGKWKRFN